MISVGNEPNRFVTDRTEQGFDSSLIRDLRISAGSSQTGSRTNEFRTKRRKRVLVRSAWMFFYIVALEVTYPIKKNSSRSDKNSLTYFCSKFGVEFGGVWAKILARIRFKRIKPVRQFSRIPTVCCQHEIWCWWPWVRNGVWCWGIHGQPL